MEGDLMILECAQGSKNVATLDERNTRFAVLVRNNDRSSTDFMNSLMNVMMPLPQAARTSITFDRGFEFRDRRKIETDIGWRTPTEAFSEELMTLR
nr:hypothetical protein [Salipiger mangrovisoli]